MRRAMLAALLPLALLSPSAQATRRSLSDDGYWAIAAQGLKGLAACVIASVVFDLAD